MKILLLVSVLLFPLFLSGCWTCDNECLKLKQDHQIQMETIRLQQMQEQAKIDASKPVQVQVAEIERKQASEEVWVWEAVIWLGMLWAAVLPLFLMD